jgi:hypothetical protein
MWLDRKFVLLLFFIYFFSFSSRFLAIVAYLKQEDVEIDSGAAKQRLQKKQIQKAVVQNKTLRMSYKNITLARNLKSLTIIALFTL